VWILDRINALQELTPAVAASDVHLFTVAPAHQIRYTNLKAHAGDMVFRGENPANGAVIDFWAAKADTAVTLSVHDPSGQLVQTIPPPPGRSVMRGINRAVWNLRYADLPIRGGGFGDDGGDAPRGNLAGPYVTPGTYTIRLAAGGKTVEQKVDVREDPRIDIAPADRKAWTDAQLQVTSLIRTFAPVNDRIQKLPATAPNAADLKRQSRELLTRLGGLYGDFGRWTGAPTRIQQSELKYYGEMVVKMSQ
jgi:hypothetical protein